MLALRFLSRILTVLLIAAASFASEMKLAPIRIVLVGDSTMARRSGWGPGFSSNLVAEAICTNMAKGGRSSGSYRAEGSWEQVINELKRDGGFKTTYVLIQFGHNDQPGKPGRSTDLTTEFPVNMRRYVEDVITNGAKPVLITPLTRRWLTNGVVKNDLDRWGAATKQVAAEMRVPVLDLNSESVAAIQRMGPAEANTLAMAPPPARIAQTANSTNSPPAPKTPPNSPGATDTNSVTANRAVERKGEAAPAFDYTHLGTKGSAFFGRMVAEELIQAVPELRPYVKPRN